MRRERGESSRKGWSESAWARFLQTPTREPGWNRGHAVRSSCERADGKKAAKVFPRKYEKLQAEYGPVDDRYGFLARRVSPNEESVMNDPQTLAWHTIVELRGELKEAQKLRAQLIGIKIAFVTAALGFVVGGSDGPQYDLIIVPAVASIFFDFLIVSYGVSIKRIGFYCRTYLEPKLRAATSWPADEPLWEEAMALGEMRQHFASSGNIGLTVLVVAPALFRLFEGGPFSPSWNYGLGVALTALFILDVLFSYVFKYAPKGRLTWPPDVPDAR